MIYMIAQYVHKFIEAATPWLVGTAAGLLVLWLIMLCYKAKPLAKELKWFFSLTPLHKFVVICTVSFFTLWGGSKERGILPSGLMDDISSTMTRVVETVQPRSLPEDVSTNALAITEFGIDQTNQTAYFATRWATNLFDYTDSRNLYLFSSTNLLERKWTPLCMIPMPADTNAHSFAVTQNDVMPSMRHWFVDTFGGVGFYRFGVDFDSDGDGIADDIETLWTFTDSAKFDTDGDGLSDGLELSPRVNTNPLAYDTDGDGVGDGDEVASGSNPRRANSDQDGLSDAQELGAMTALVENDFMWFDVSDGTDLLSDYSTLNSYSWKIPLVSEIVVNEVCYTNARVCVDGTVHLLCPTNVNDWYAHYYGNLSNSQWSASHLTVALCGANLYARTSDWGSRILYGSIVSDGRSFDVVEYRNLGLYDHDDTNELITCQLILPHDETNTVYVSYLCASNTFREVSLAVGIQCGWLPSGKSGERYYNLSWPIAADFPQDGLTIRYSIGTCTDPSKTDTDGDGLSDSEEVLTYRTNPLVADTDGDGIPDGVEVSVGTDPRSADTDADGMPDGWEAYYGLNPLVDDSALDLDNDGLSNYSEYAAGTNPAESDTDEDGIGDRDELGWWEYPSALPVFSYSNETNLISSSSGYDDDMFLVDLPFEVRFAGYRATKAKVSVNGFVWLVTDIGEIPTSSDYGNQNLSTNARSQYHGFIAAYWDDLYACSGRNAQLSVSDAYANGQRYCVIKYQNISIRGDASNMGTFRVVIPESETNTVYVAYDSLASGFNGAGATIGAQSPNMGCNFPVAYNESGSVSNGMVIAYHFGTGSNPLMTDTDGDGLEDGDEVAIGTIPAAADTDNDGLMDGWEVSNSFNPLSTPGNGESGVDTDGDGLTNLQEQSAGSNPRNADSDGDGLSDSAEFLTHHTNPLVADTDGDGMTDKQETDANYDPLDPDMDRDGMPDGWENAHGLAPQDATGDDGADGDPDNDGLSNIDEYLNGTNPNLPDSDGDGVSDGVEVANGSDPNDASDGGQAPPVDKFREIEFNINGDYAAWEMTIEGLGPDDTRTRKISMGRPNAANTTTLKMRKGNSYRLSMRWLNCAGHDDDMSPWYCWQALIDGLPSQASFDHNYSEGICVRLPQRNNIVVGNGWIADNEDGLLTSHVHASQRNSHGGSGAGNVAQGLSATLYVLDDPKLIPDYDRDGTISDGDKTKAEQRKAHRFWMNDDEDDDSTDGKYAESPSVDIPGARAGWFEFDKRDPDWDDSKVNGYRDLIDFTPVFMDVSTIQMLPERIRNSLTFKLSHAAGAVNVVWSDLPKSSVGLFQKENVGVCGRDLNEVSYAAGTERVESDGIAVPDALVAQMKASSSNKGVVFIEGREATSAPLKLDIYYNDQKVVTGELPLHLSSVEEMYRWLNSRGLSGEGVDFPSRLDEPPNRPDSETSDRHLVFVHGANVTQDGARGWASEIFKRMWQSGMTAKFTAVTWRSDIGSDANYQENVSNTFFTASVIVQQIKELPGAKVLMAHSLGNMVCSSMIQDYGLVPACYLMCNSAVPAEAYDSDSSLRVPQLVHPEWVEYPTNSWASSWHWLFRNEPNDDRKFLGWPGRFSNVAQYAVNFYSTGDEVLELAGNNNVHTWTGISDSWGHHSWHKQELFKGRGGIGGTSWSGWNIDENIFGGNKISVMEAQAMTEYDFRTNTVFYCYPSSMNSTNISLLVRGAHLAQGIPALTPAAGRMKFGDLRLCNDSFDCNAILQIARPNGWPERCDYRGQWCHSDLKDVAYFYVFKFYAKAIEKGDLR